LRNPYLFVESKRQFVRLIDEFSAIYGAKGWQGPHSHG